MKPFQSSWVYILWEIVLNTLEKGTMKNTKPLRLSMVLLGMIFLVSAVVLSDADSVSLTEDLSIGIDYGDESMMFGSISDIQLDAEENIYILDGKKYRIQVFDPQGGFLRSISLKKGQGPEEVSMLFGFAVHPDGLISIYDRAGNKVLNFDEKGYCQNYFKLDFQAFDIRYYKDGQIAILGFDNDLGVHIYNRKGDRIFSFAEPFSIPSRMSKYKDAPFTKFPLKFSSTGDGTVFILNPHKYEIFIYKEGKLTGDIKGKSDFFRPLTIQGQKGEGGRQYMSLIFPTVSVLTHEDIIFVTIRGLPIMGEEESKNQMQIYKNQKLIHSLDVKGFLSAVDSKGRLYLTAYKEGFPVMKRFILEDSEDF